MMGSRPAWSGLCLGLSLAACGMPDVGDVAAEPAAIANGLPPEGVLGAASVRIVIGGESCTATRIAPRWLLTAAHCTRFWSQTEDNAGGLYDACFAHPNSAFPGGLVRCGEVEDEHAFVRANDISLLHLASPVTVVRSIAPPRLCSAPVHSDCTTCTAGESCDIGHDRCVHQLPITIRGFGGDSFRAPVAHGRGYTDGSGVFFKISSPDDVGMLRPGDSGGTFTSRVSDDTGPIVAVTGFQGVISGGAFVWDPSNIDWIWSVLAPSGRCDATSSTACAVEDPYLPACVVGTPVPLSLRNLPNTTLDLTVDGVRRSVTMVGDFGGGGESFVPNVNDLFPCPSPAACRAVATFLPGPRTFRICGRVSGPGGAVAINGGDAAPIMGLAGLTATGDDTCGNGVCTAAEDNTSCPDDCVALGDTDGDHLPDVRDLCPTRALAVGASQHRDDDHDFIGNDCEATAACETTCGNDLDYDGQQDDSGCDNCPGLFNPDQSDCDHDGQGDACDPDDVDHDGVTDACDSCPTIANPAQANCNADSEIVGGACDRLAPGASCPASAPNLVGDACDPNPCGYTRTDMQSETVPVAGVPSNQRFLVPDRIRVHGIVHSADGSDVFTPTGFRYCACSVPGLELDDSLVARTACAQIGSRPCLTTSVRTSTVTTRASLAFDTSDLPATPAWRHISSTGFTFAGPVRHHFVSGGSGLSPLGTDVGFDWALWATDVPRWAGPYGDRAVTPTDIQFPGVLWTHEFDDRTAGATSVRELRSHYESGPLQAQFFVELPAPGSTQYHWPLPDCLYNHQLPCLGQPSWVHVGGPDVHTHSAIIGHLGAIDVGDLYPSAPMFAATDLAWVHAAEPVEMLAASQTLRLVSAARDGSRLVDSLHISPLGYAPPGWHSGCPGVGCPPPVCDPRTDPYKCLPHDPQIAARAAAATEAVADPLFVLSASRGELFVVQDGIRAFDVDDGSVRSLDLGSLTLASTLLAATYDVTRDRLVVIDQSGASDRGRHSRPPTVRLIEINPSGGASVLATWSRRGSSTRFALGAATDGRLYLAASGDSGRYALVSLEVVHHGGYRHSPGWDEVVSRRVSSGEGALLSTTTYASRFAVTFLVLHDGHESVASYEPSAPRSDREEHEHDERGGDCMGDVF